MMVSFVFDHREGEMAATFANACKEVSTRLRRNSICDALEKKALLAIIEKSPEEAKRLLLVVSRRNKLGLKIIKTGS
jgi:hypothetical protein